MTYSCLHAHSHYSIDGIGTIPEWIDAAKAKGLYGLAITDPGHCCSLLEFYTIGKEKSFPVVLGSEFYLVENLDKTKENKYCHITILVKNAEGYRNICRLSTLSFSEDHFYYKPRITLDELFAHRSGLMVLSGCLLGIIGQTAMKGDPAKAKEIAMRFKDGFRDDFYLELLPIKVSPNKGKGELSAAEGGCDNIQETVNKILIEISAGSGIKMVATPDAHMPEKRHKILQDIKLANQSPNWKYEDTYYLPDAEDFKNQFKKNHPYIDASVVDSMLANTCEIVDKAKGLELKFSPILPKPYEGDSYEILLDKIREHNKIDLENPAYVERLMLEIETIKDNGYIDLTNYFLLLEDAVSFCRTSGIQVGVGRGSAAGSLLAYALGITDVDPIKYGLLFSRFLNASRLKKGTLPDIDLDFSDRDAVISYLQNKYGVGRVCKLGTITTLKLKSAIKDAMRCLMGENFDFALANTLTKGLDNDLTSDEAKTALATEMLTNTLLNSFMKDNPGIMDIVFEMIGQNRQFGIHASGIAITPIDLTEIIPLATSKGEWYTQYTAPWCEKAGVIKFDILTVNTLGYINKAVSLIEERTGEKINPYRVSFEDPKIYEEFRKGNTDFVFQFNSDVSRNFLQNTKVESIEDLSQITAVGRPGTMDSGLDRIWIKKRNMGDFTCELHSSMEDLLRETNGTCIYQEQLMKCFMYLADFTEDEADDIRKATGKKNLELMESFKADFIDRAHRKNPGLDKDMLENIWKKLETFAGYSFNKSHSVAYSIIGYICQWLKTYHPLEWWTGTAQSLLESASSDKKDKLKELYRSAKEYLVLPDINRSGEGYYIDGDVIFMPLTILNGIGEASIKDIIATRYQFGSFQSFDHFLMVMKGKGLRRNVVLALIWAGCFRGIDQSTEKELALKYLNSLMSEKKGDKKRLEEDYKEVFNMNQIDIVKRKVIALGFSDEDSYNCLGDIVPKGTIFDYNMIQGMMPKRELKLVGTIEKIKEHQTRKGDTMAFLDVENDGLKISLTIWPEDWYTYKEMVKKGALILAHGIVNEFKNKKSVVVEKLAVLG